MPTNSALLVPPPSSATLTTSDIRPIKVPVEIPDDWAWLWWTLGIVVLLALATMAVVWLLRKRAEPALVPLVPPHVRAKERLHAAMGLISDPRLFCIEVSTITRVYLEERFNFH